MMVQCCIYRLFWSMFPPSFVCFWASSGDTGMYSSADILRRELYFFCSSYVLRQYFGHFFLAKRVKCSAILIVSLNQIKAISSPGLLGCRPYFWQLYRCMTHFPHIANFFLVNACWLRGMSRGIWTNNKSSFAGKTTYPINGVSLSNDFHTKGTLYTSRI